LKIRITHPVDGYMAGLIYDVPDLKAAEILKADCGVKVDDDTELVDVSIYDDPSPAFVETTKKKVKHGDR
jgi:hypothetical protein